MTDTTRKIPRADLAKVPELKVTDYLLRDDHPEGGSKSRFLGCFGFDRGDWQGLQTTLYLHAGTANVVNEIETLHGTEYEIRGELESPDGRDPEVLSKWVIERGDSSPMFVTLDPLKGDRPEMIAELERVALSTDISETALREGDVGTVVHVHVEHAAYEVEFISFSGESLGVFTIEEESIRRLGEDDLPSTRSLSASA